MSEVFRLILASTLSASVLIAVLLALRPILRNKLSRAWQYYLWIIVLLRLAVPLTPSFGLTGWLFRDDTAPAVQAGAVLPTVTPNKASVDASSTVDIGITPADAGKAVTSIPAAAAPVPNRPAISRAADILGVAGSFWLAGACAALVIKAIRYASFARSIEKSARPVVGTDILQLLTQIAGDMGLKKVPALYINAAVDSPMLLGLIRPVIYLPDEKAADLDDSLPYVLRHELTHLKRLDILYKWLNELVFCMHWFNPLVYLMTRQIGRDCELSCDEAVAVRLDKAGKMAYGKAVLDAAEQCARVGLLSAGLRGDKANIKERLGTILKSGKSSKSSFAAALALVCALTVGGVLLGACTAGKATSAMAAVSPSPSQSGTVSLTPSPSASAAAAEEQAVRKLVTEFGQQLQNVELLAPADTVVKIIDDTYARYVTPELLSAWKADPEHAAPGRTGSSPWPDRIDISGTAKNTDGSYTVSGNIIEVTSTEVLKGTAAATRPVTITIVPSGGTWLISAWNAGARVISGSSSGASSYPSGTAPAMTTAQSGFGYVYRNTDYGFNFSLPADWKDFTIVSQTWNGTWVDGSSTPGPTGPELLIRSPKWTSANPTQDIPIMIFTLDQWAAVSNEKLAVSAAPIPPSELGRNSKYVFALPARYNFAFLPGYEEVEQLLKNKPLQPTENISIKPEGTASSAPTPAPAPAAALPTAAPAPASAAALPTAAAAFVPAPAPAAALPSSAPLASLYPASNTLKITYNGVPINDVTIRAGDAVMFTFTPAFASADNTPVWSMDDSSVASVTDGKVLALSSGTTTLTLTVGGSSAQCVIRVK